MLLRLKKQGKRMSKETEQTLKKIEKQLVKLRNKVRRADLEYTVQISVSSADPTVIIYAAQMTAPAKGLAPVTFIAKSADELIAQIKVSTKYMDYDKVEIAYHKAQVDACYRTIQGHEDRIKEIEGATVTPKEEPTSEQEPTE